MSSNKTEASTTGNTDRKIAEIANLQDASSLETQAKDNSLKPSQPTTINTATKPISKTHIQQRLDPTRYGDWEKNGRCIDF